MFGAIYGDIIGSYYEAHCTKNYNFEFSNESTFTDDTVLTVAICKAILNNSDDIKWYQVKERAFEYASQIRQYYYYYPYVGFGNMFMSWANSDGNKRNRSYANGGAMRVVPIGYAYDSIEQVMLQAKASCLYTHNHREAITAAQAVATAVFLARNKYSKNEIKKYIEKKFPYNLSRTVSELREAHVFNSRSSYSVPAALISFFDSYDYESAVRNAVSLGGDADTEACIAGGIAEAFYNEIPDKISIFVIGDWTILSNKS